MATTLRSAYMEDAWNWDKVGRKAQGALRDVDYDTLVGTGLSGAIIVPYLARRLKKHALIVRKPQDGSHSWRPVEGVIGDRWVFVDDFIDSGATLNRVRKTIEDLANPDISAPLVSSMYVGHYLYSDHNGGFTAAESE